MARLQPLLEVQGVSKNFGGVQALRDLDLSVNPGEVVGIIGPNGAGKSTLFNIICGSRPTSGRILFKGEDVTGRRVCDVCHRGIARTFQLTRSFLEISVRSNVASGLLFGRNPRKISGVKEAGEQATAILKEVKLDHRCDTLASRLLFAERRRLELARALATGPELLLLDEVMAGLNSAESEDLLEILTALRHKYGLTLVIIEHIMKVVMSVCERVIVINYGSKLAEGAPAEIVRNKEVIAAYLGEECA